MGARNRFWWIAHCCIAHPLMSMDGAVGHWGSRMILRFHDWTVDRMDLKRVAAVLGTG